MGPGLEPPRHGPASVAMSASLPVPRSIPEPSDLLKETMSEHFNGLSDADWGFTPK